MIDTPQIVQTEMTKTAVIHLTVPRADMEKEFGPAVSELFGELQRQGIQPAGALFAHHFIRPSSVFDFELGVPVTEDVTPNGRVKASSLPAATVARTTYQGPYEGLADGWSEFHAWVREAGHKHTEALWEVYVVGPEITQDPADYRTELNRPLIID